MSFLYKRGKYWWYGRGVYRKSTKTANKQIAQKIKEKWDNDYALSRAGIDPLQNITIQELLFEFSHYKEPTPRDRLGINHFLNFTGPKTNIRKINVRTINQFIIHRKKQGRAPNTIKNDLNPIRQIFDYAVANHYLLINPVKYSVTLSSKPIKPRLAIPKETIKEIFEMASPEDLVYWMVCYYTGLSCTDAGTLKPKYVKDGVIYTTRTKTKVPVPVPLHPKLLKQKNRIYGCMLTKGKRDQSNRRFKAICKKLKIENGVVYSLRHSFVSHLFDAGLSLDDIKVVAGHTTAHMTSHYTHAQIETIKTYIEKLQ